MLVRSSFSVLSPLFPQLQWQQIYSPNIHTVIKYLFSLILKAEHFTSTWIGSSIERVLTFLMLKTCKSFRYILNSSSMVACLIDNLTKQLIWWLYFCYFRNGIWLRIHREYWNTRQGDCSSFFSFGLGGGIVLLDKLVGIYVLKVYDMQDLETSDEICNFLL